MLSLFLAAAVTLAAPQIELQTLAGEQHAGELLRWTGDEIALQGDDGEVVHSVRRLLSVRPAADPSSDAPRPQGAWVELVDGSLLVGADCSVSKGKLHLSLGADQSVALPTAAVASVRLKPHNEALARQWDEIRQARVAGDVVVIRKKEALDYLEGVLGDVTAEHVQFRFDGEQVPVKRERVDGLVYFHPQAPKTAELAAVVKLAGGSRLSGGSVRWEDGRLHVLTTAGVDVPVRLDDVEQVDYSAGKIQYLSDLTPESVKWTPYFGLPPGAAALERFGLPSRDRALEGGPLTLSRQERPGKWTKVVYSKGIALRSRTEVVYRLPDRFRRFTAVAGIDDRVRDAGHVRLVISGDERMLLDTEIAGQDDPIDIDLDITGVRRLKILVDYGDDLDIADHLDLCDARISK